MGRDDLIPVVSLAFAAGAASATLLWWNLLRKHVDNENVQQEFLQKLEGMRAAGIPRWPSWEDVRRSVVVDNSNNSINDLFMRFPVPVLYEATYYSDSIPSKYTEELEKLNKLSALNDQHRKEYKATEEYQIKKEQSKNGIVTITLSREAKEISNANTKQALKVMYMRMSQPFGIELNFGAQCEGSWKFTFHKVNRQWEVYDNSPSRSGYPCHHPTETCDETYNQQVKRDS